MDNKVILIRWSGFLCSSLHFRKCQILQLTCKPILTY